MRLKKTLRRVLRPLIEDALEDALARDAKNIERHFRREALQGSADFILERMPEARPLPDKWAVLDLGMRAAAPLLQADPEALVCEFGVASGATVNHIARGLPGRTVYGFDSFEGLPEDWRDGYPKGAFRRRALPRVEGNVELVKGRFDQTLAPFLQDRRGSAAFLHVDCDLYSSTKTVFEAFAGRLGPGAVLVFDEYFNYPGWERGEHLALVEFLDENRLDAAYLGYCKFHQQVVLRLVSPGEQAGVPKG